MHDKYISRNHEFLNITGKQTMFLASLIERLAEMFPKQDYASRLNRYIESQQPSSISEIEHYQTQFDRSEIKGTVL